MPFGYTIISSVFSVITGIVYYNIKKNLDDFKNLKKWNNQRDGRYFFENITIETLDKNNIYESKKLVKYLNNLPKSMKILNENFNRNLIYKHNSIWYKIKINNYKCLSSEIKSFIDKDQMLKIQHYNFDKNIYVLHYVEKLYIPPKIECNFVGNIYFNNLIYPERFYILPFEIELKNLKKDERVFKILLYINMYITFICSLYDCKRYFS